MRIMLPKEIAAIVIETAEKTNKSPTQVVCELIQSNLISASDARETDNETVSSNQPSL